MAVALGEACASVPVLADGFVDVLAGLRGALDGLFALDPVVLAGGEVLLGLLAEASRVEALVCREAAAFDRGGEWVGVGAQNAAVWVSTRARCGLWPARRRLRLGHALGWMDLVAEAFAAGRVGIDHVDALAGARDRSRATAVAFGRDEAMLVGWAESEKFHRFTAALDAWVQLADVEQAEGRAAKAFGQRRFHVSQSFENCWFADGVFDPVSGQIIHDTLTRIERELFEVDWADTRARLGREPYVSELGRTGPQRRVDALVEMACRAETTPKDGQRPAPLFTIVVGVDAFARTCELASGTVLTPGMAARWVNEALIERVVFDGPDRVISVGRRRGFTGALRRAIEVRDRTCRHPYCDEPAERCQVDHIVPFALGGETTQQNGELRCGFHNRQRNPEHLKPDKDGRSGGSGSPRKPPRFSGDE